MKNNEKYKPLNEIKKKPTNYYKITKLLNVTKLQVDN